VGAALAEHGIDEIGGAVQDLRRVGEAGSDVEHALDPYDALDAFEITDRRLELTDGVERRELAGLVALLCSRVRSRPILPLNLRSPSIQGSWPDV